LASDKIGVVVGMAAEARIAGRLGWPVAVGRDAAQRLLDAGAGALVSLGVAGGLDPALRPGTLIVADTVIVCGNHHATDPELSRRLGGSTGHIVLGGDTIISTSTEKRRLYMATRAAAVDLESGAVAGLAVRNNIPFAVLRVICDPASQALPPAALAALDAHGAIGLWRVLASIAAQPGQLPALLALASDAAMARRALAERVRQIARGAI
jgi:adenosylhomocysteine nucleosidase